ncbi:exo-alpha-sialidase [Fontimonas sp. SYSU GA230001]|uniref:exo-alpha-sialidase n=1 Tax=Fontimonas sp. SYSU GA230001 TaxID=3142450 RepID=UPI0032B4424F
MTILRACAATAALLCSLSSLAADPASGTLTPGSGPIVFSSGPFLSANPTPVPLLDNGPTCDSPAPACDSFELTVSLPAGYTAAHNADFVRVTMSWVDTGGGASDYDLWIYKGQVDATDGGDTPPFKAASSANPEVTQIVPLADGDTVYTIKIVPYTPSGEIVTTTIEFVTGDNITTDPSFGLLDNPATPGIPRYQNFAPTGVSAEAGNGECNIGFNVHTLRIMFMCFGNGSVYRLTTPENLVEPLPEACPAQWEDVTPLATSGPQPVADPILFTDRVSGRTWASNLTVGPNVSYAFTDDDGDNWIDAGAGGLAGADHQTIGSGPYPADFALPHPLHDNAVYFCSQALVGPAGCVRSDDGGATWGPPTLAYDGSVCGGLHGHVRVANDGTVWLPVATCGEGTGYAVSTDAGQTWTDRMVPNTLAGSGSDPSIALDDDNTAYFCYVNGDGHARVAVSRDRGQTWTDDTDLGAAHGVVNATFPEAWGGSSGRAACGFLGTDRLGNMESLDFPGLWYLFIAHTYDGGKTWTTVNATPADPVQGIGGIWHSGGGNPNRNLLDFNEVTEDQLGRVLFGYDDGCVRDCAKSPLDNPQSFTAVMKVARQTGGKTLRAEHDRPEPRAPANACLSGTRDQFAAKLNWLAPDHGGAAITNYKVYRSTSPTEPGVFVGNAGPKLGYLDRSADPNVEKYYYTVVAENAAGEGVASNKVELPVVERVIENLCVLPGYTLFSDASGDYDTALATGTSAHDLLLLQVAQPPVTDGVTKLVFTLKVADLRTPPPSAAWFVSFRAPNGELRGVRMATDQGSARFFSYTVGQSSGGITDGRFVAAEGPIEAESNYTADGIITFVVKASDVGGTGAPGETYTEFNAGSVQTYGAAGTGAADAIDGMPNGLARQGRITLSPNGQCPDILPDDDTPPGGTTGGGAGGSRDQGRFGGAIGGAALLALLGLLGLRRRIAA